MAVSQTRFPRDTVGLNPTGRPRKSSASSRRKAARRAAAAQTGGAK